MSWLAGKKILVLLPILLLSIILVAPLKIPPVHALTGEVCLADPTANIGAANSCPTSPPVFSGQAGQQIRIGVFISGSDPVAGFDITLLSNESVLVPAYVSANVVDLTGSVINTAVTGPSIVITLCVNGQLVSGSTCSNPDRLDTIHLVATAALGKITTSPTTGLLFTALFNITGTNSGSQPVGFQSPVNDKNGNPTTECRPPQTSTIGYCVTIANGTPTPDVETVQNATFNNSGSSSMPSVILSENATSFGPEFPGTANRVNVTATTLNGYMINSTNSVQFTTIATLGLSVSSTTSSCSSAPCSTVFTLNPSAAGNYTLTVTGNYISKDSAGNPDTLASTVSLFVIAYDFTITITPLSVTFISGEIGNATATITSLNGFAGVVTLSNQVNPTTMTVNDFPSSVSISRGQLLTSTVTFKASPTTQTTYHARVTAAFGSRTKVTPIIAITVTAPVSDFYLFATPKTIGPLDAGASGTATVTVGYANGFSGTVNLSVSPSSLGTLNQTSVTSSHNVTLAASASVAKNYALTVTAFNATVSRSITFTLIVVDFNLTAAPNPITVGQGFSQTTSVSVTALNGFTGSVSLTSVQSTGLTATITPNVIVGSGNALLNVTAAGSMAPGMSYTVNVTGTSSVLLHLVRINVTVAPNDFQISATPNSVSAYPGLGVNSTISLSSLFGFSGSVNLAIKPLAQVSAIFTPASVSVPKGGSGTAILTLSSSSMATFTVNVTATSGALLHFVLVTFRVNTDVDFAITLPYAQASISEGSTQRIPVTVTSENGFTGTLTLTYTIVKPTGFAGVDVPNATLTPSTLSLVPGFHQNITVVITVRNTVVSQIFGINITGTSRSLVLQGPTLSLVVPPPGFSIVSNPSPLTVGPGMQANFAVTVTAVNGLFGTVSLSAVTPSGVTCLAIPSLVLSRNGSATTSLSCTGPVGQNNVTITGSGTTPYGSGFTKSGSATFVVASFTVSPTPTGILVNTSQQGNAKIAISWTNNFNGNVTFKLIPQNGLTASIDSASLTGSGSTMVHVVSTTAGTYTLVVNATSGSYTQSVTLTVTVSAPANSSIDPVILYGGIGVGIVAVIAAALLLMRRGKRSKTR